MCVCGVCVSVCVYIRVYMCACTCTHFSRRLLGRQVSTIYVSFAVVLETWYGNMLFLAAAGSFACMIVGSSTCLPCSQCKRPDLVAITLQKNFYL